MTLEERANRLWVHIGYPDSQNHDEQMILNCLRAVKAEGYQEGCDFSITEFQRLMDASIDAHVKGLK